MYNKTITFSNNELPAKVNIQTGEIVTFQNNKRQLPEGKLKSDSLFLTFTNTKIVRLL